MGEKNGMKEYDALKSQLQNKISEFMELERGMGHLKEEISNLEGAIARLHDTLPPNCEILFEKQYGPLLERMRTFSGRESDNKMKLIVEKVIPKVETCNACGVTLPLHLSDDPRFHHWVIRGSRVCEKCFMHEVMAESEKGRQIPMTYRKEGKW
jgi:hypothetical protein